MKTIYKFSLMMFAVICLTACDKLTGILGNSSDYDFLTEMLGDKPEKMKVDDIKFSPDYKTFTMTTDIVQDIGPYNLVDSSQVRLEVVETIDGIREAVLSMPKLLKIKNIEADSIAKADIRILVLVDLTLSQSNLDKVSSYVSEMTRSFSHDNLFVAFMDGPEVSNTIKVTDYVIGNHFKKSSNNYVYLYRSILNKREEMLQGGEFWQDAQKLVMLIFSDGKIYNDETDEPIDPEHYKYEEQMVQLSADSTMPFTAFYTSLNSQQDIKNDHDEKVMLLFCHNSGGTFMKTFDWVSCKRNILNAVGCSFPDHELYFVNPDLKVYRGDNKKLTVNFYNAKTDSLIVSVSKEVVLGDIFNPIIVNGNGILYVILQGLFIGIGFLLLLYLILQLIVPYFKYRKFKRKYVFAYTGRNMCFNNNPVEESCYLCKAPFEEGDKIVVKCSHTMHKSCWDENEYHCPEYSDRCKDGSHYYNSSHLFDSHNAPFYLKWILVAIVAATLAWLCFTVYIHEFFGLYSDKVFHFFENDSKGTVNQMPIFGLIVGFFLTAGFSLLAIRPGKDGMALGMILLRSILAAIGCFLSFLLVNILIVLFDINNFAFLLNWIPWTASGFIIALCSTFATRLVHNKWLVLIAVVLGVLSMYAWTFLFTYTELDYRVLLLFSFIIFSVGLSACMATVAPRSEHYYLKIQGATKGMDIALYKWFRNDSERVVTIGKSVDCSLQLSWDLQSNVAPVQAEIRLKRKLPFLIALEPGVYMKGKSVEVNKKVRLYHGRSFTIGQTTFTYIEKDR